MGVRLGIDVLLDDVDDVLGGKNAVLITGSSNVDSAGKPVYQQLKRHLGKRLQGVWSLQHGFMIDKQDNMILSDSFYFKEWDLHIRSLYGRRLLPDDDWLDGLDTVIVDVFDVGTRVYTFINHVLMVMKRFSGKDVEFLVLDRPNPLGGIDCEGNVADRDYFSIVGQLPVPMRHSLTAGEFLAFGIRYYRLEIACRIIQLWGWDRRDFFEGLWTYPSPNMPALNTALVYPGAVLLEGTNLSEGRGTTRPFEFVGAPYLDAGLLIDDLDESGLKGVEFVPIYFKPEFSKFSGDICKGILVCPLDPLVFRSFAVYYEIIRLVRRRYPGQFEWKQPPYEFEYQRLPVDMINASDTVRLALENDIPFREFEADFVSELESFREIVGESLLY